MTLNLEDPPRSLWRAPIWIVMIGLCLSFWLAVAAALGA